MFETHPPMREKIWILQQIWSRQGGRQTPATRFDHPGIRSNPGEGSDQPNVTSAIASNRLPMEQVPEVNMKDSSGAQGSPSKTKSTKKQRLYHPFATYC